MISVTIVAAAVAFSRTRSTDILQSIAVVAGSHKARPTSSAGIASIREAVTVATPRMEGSDVLARLIKMVFRSWCATCLRERTSEAFQSSGRRRQAGMYEV